MGRKSSLSPEQWVEIERRHLVDGEPVRKLAKEFGVDEAAIRRRINPQKSADEKSAKSLRELADAKVSADKAVKVAEIDDAKPLDQQSIDSLKGIAVLTRMANESSEIAVNLLNANKETVKKLNEPSNPADEVHRVELVPMDENGAD
jgi:hypothetical protein